MDTARMVLVGRGLAMLPHERYALLMEVGMLHGEESRAGDVSRLVADASSAAEVIEGRLFGLIREAARGTIPFQDFSTELSLLSKDLRRWYKRLAEVSDRRDLGFSTVEALERLGRHCLWLYRKSKFEQAFHKKFDLEARLRSMISSEAYAIYQDMLCVEEAERRLLAKSDAELRRELLGEP